MHIAVLVQLKGALVKQEMLKHLRETVEEYYNSREINGIVVGFDSALAGTVELILDKEENVEGSGLVLLGANNSYY